VQKHRIVTESPSAAKTALPIAAKAAPHPLHHAEFLDSVANERQLPPPGAPEIAFAGRSNAGKSSAINALANRARLAFTSKMPGRTQQINFFRLRGGALLADLPGYGYAAVPRPLKEHWQQFLARYLATRQSLIGLVLVVDARTSGASPCNQDGQVRGVGTAGRGPRDRAGHRGGISICSGSGHDRAVFRDAPHRDRDGGSNAGAVASGKRDRDGRSGFRKHKRRGPASKGNGAGPEIPSIGLVTTEGARSGREAGDVAVWQSRQWGPTGVPTWRSISQESIPVAECAECGATIFPDA
jgi:hypothetical protein